MIINISVYFLKKIFLTIIKKINKLKKAIKGIETEGVEIIWYILGAVKLFSIIFSNPLAIDVNKNKDGIIPKNVDQKKLVIFTLKIHGIIFCIWNGMPPTNL